MVLQEKGKHSEGVSGRFGYLAASHYLNYSESGPERSATKKKFFAAEERPDFGRSGSSRV